MSGTTEGGTSTTTATATDAAATATTTAGATTTTDTDTAAAQGATTASAAPTIEQLQADVEKWKAHSRKNEAALKAKNDGDKAQAQLLADVAAKLGIQTAGGTPDAAQITARLEAAERDAKTRSTELAVLRAAYRLGADGDALLDSRAFVAQLETLDGTEAIEAVIKLAVAQNPGKYAAAAAKGTATDAAATGTGAATATASASSTGDFTGSAGGSRQWTQEDVDRAKPDQVVKAMEQGLLRALLGG